MSHRRPNDVVPSPTSTAHTSTPETLGGSPRGRPTSRPRKPADWFCFPFSLLCLSSRRSYVPEQMIQDDRVHPVVGTG